REHKPTVREKTKIVEREGASRRSRDSVLPAVGHREIRLERKLRPAIDAVGIEVELRQLARIRIVEAEIETAVPASPEGLVQRREKKHLEEVESDVSSRRDDDELARRIRGGQRSKIADAGNGHEIEELVRLNRDDPVPLDLDVADA